MSSSYRRMMGSRAPAAHSNHRTLVWLTLYAIAMANVEAALVVHLRNLYYPDDPRFIFPLSVMSTHDFIIEVGRELATLVMILGVAVLAARELPKIFAAFVYVFGVWDLFYYVWLKIMIDWPVVWLEWDVLFLIPWPWFGPWLAPVLVSLTFMIWGGWIIATDIEARLSRWPALALLAGAAMVVTSFLLPAVALLPAGADAFQRSEPTDFPWSLFLTGYLVMSGSLWRIAKHRNPGGPAN